MALEIQRTLVLSTAHVPQHTQRELQESIDDEGTAKELVVYLHGEYGWNISTSNISEILEGKDSEVRKNHPTLCNLLSLTKERNCHWLRIDCDGLVQPNLPTFEENVNHENKTNPHHQEEVL